jgi:type IV secretory pathway VirB6-like protein
MIKKGVVIILGALAMGVIGCSSEPESAADKAKKSMHDTVEATKEAARDASNATKEMAHDAAKATEKAAHDAQKAIK